MDTTKCYMAYFTMHACDNCDIVIAYITHESCESWTLRKNEETRLDAFEMKGLRRMLRVSWTAKKTN